MGANASRVVNQFDAAASVLLANNVTKNTVATITDTAVSLNELRTAYWHNFEVPHGKFDVTWDISACDAGNSDETYTLALVVDDVANIQGAPDNPVVIDQFAWPRGQVGVVTRTINAADIPNLDPDHSGLGKWMATRTTLAGTTPSITYSAWMGKCRGA